MKHILFICRQSTSEPSAAEKIFAQQHSLEILYAEPSENAKVQLNPALVEWADIIFVMTKTDLDTLQKKFRKYITRQQIIFLDIPDDCDSPDPDTIKILQDTLL